MQFLNDQILRQTLVAMPSAEFDTHEYFANLRRNHQLAYIRELNRYVEDGSPDPDKAVHTQIARRLDHPAFSDILRKVPGLRRSSRNDHGINSPVQVWQRIGGSIDGP